MEVVPLNLPRRSSPAGTVGLPFNKRNVQEWSRLDRLTGMMESAKIETDHWAARNSNGAHKYGKMIDSRERNNADGSLQQRQRKQMEVFQSQVQGGSMQVIRTQTVTTSSSSSKWASKIEKGFDDLELPINSLDLSSQKTKGSVGRSGSIGGRRPPSRPRSLISQSSSSSIFGEESSVTRLCQRLHDQAKSEMFRTFPDYPDSGKTFNGFSADSDAENDQSGVVITEIPNSPGDNPSVWNNLSRQKSCSNENVAAVDDENVIRRSSKIRRSLQFPKPSHSPISVQESEWSPGKSLKERAAEIENLLRRGSSTATTISQDSDRSSESSEKTKTNKTRDSFVSAEKLKEVRERLKKAGSSENENEMKDDGIVTEKDDPSGLSSRVKCFVYGMEAMMAGNKKPKVNGTGSLESRSSSKNYVNGSRTAEWYRRRKSYGFEQVDESEKFDKFNRKCNMESSTDSGICQSSETVGIPAWNKLLPGKTDAFAARPAASTIVTLGGRKDVNESSVNSVYVDNQTGVTSVRVDEAKRDENRRKIFRHYTDDALQSESVWNRKSPLPIQRNSDVRESLKSSLRSAKNPWISQLRGTKLVDRNWASDEHNDSEEVDQDRKSPEDDFKTGLTDSDSSNQRKNKKVEFCKTEVHFAAESGKFNIVETDGKPPPTDIFRRRRRNSGPTLPKNPTGLPEIKFGDSVYEKRLLTVSEQTESISDKIEAELKELSRIIVEPLPQSKERKEDELRSCVTSKLYDLEEESNELDNLRPRSILKNYRKSFLLGESESAGKSDPSPPVWKSTVILRNKLFDDIKKRNAEDGKLYSSDGESELQIRFRNLKKADPEQKSWRENCIANKTDPIPTELKRRSLPDDILLRHAEGSKIVVSSEEMPSLSVAERIKQVEELKSNNYSSKINFRFGETTVVQNGTGSSEGEVKRSPVGQKNDWEEDRIARERSHIVCDNVATSNPPVMRFSTQDKTDNQKYQTTRILINFQSQNESPAEKLKTNNINKPYGSWSPGMKRDLGKYFSDLKSTSLVRQTINGSEDRQESFQREDIPKPSKPVLEIVNQFDSLSLPKKNNKERRRKTMPINYKAPKEYTHADLEEELKNFTENLDKDFKDIYEEEIGSLKAKPQRKETEVRPVILNRNINLGLLKSSSDDGSKRSKTNYESDDSDLLADEEVRSYMSTGQGGTDSEPEVSSSWSSRKSIEESIVRCKNVLNGHSEIKSEPTVMKNVSSSFESFSSKKISQPEQPKIASIALRYEDDPLFAKTKKTSQSDRWEKLSNSSSISIDKPRERATYLNGLSLSEKYSKYLQRSSNSSLDSASQYGAEPVSTRRSVKAVEPEQAKYKYVPRNMRSAEVKPKEEVRVKLSSLVGNSSISSSSRYRSKLSSEKETSSSSRRSAIQTDKKRNLSERMERRRKERDETDSVILEQLTRAADEILIAVNGYTDEDSHLASSEEEAKSRKIFKRDKLGGLGTISEGKRVTKTEARTATTAQTVRRTGNHSSASSLESLTKESAKTKVCPRLKQSESKPLSSRATRLLQRASSREALMAQQSSSEDIPSYVELAKKRNVRRQRSNTSVKSDASADSKPTCSRLRSRTKTAPEVSTASAVTRSSDRKSIPGKENASSTRSTRKCQTETERTNSISRRTSDKAEPDATRRRRIQRSRDEMPNVITHKSKTSRINLKKVESSKSVQVA